MTNVISSPINNPDVLLLAGQQRDFVTSFRLVLCTHVYIYVVRKVGMFSSWLARY